MKKILIITLLGCLFLVGCGASKNATTSQTTTKEQEKIMEDTSATETEDSEDSSPAEIENSEDSSNIENEAVTDSSPYTYADMNVTMYAAEEAIVKDIPSNGGKRLGQLVLNQEVAVTGQCKENSWYRIDYNGKVGYVSNDYLVSEKIAVASENENNDVGVANGENENNDVNVANGDNENNAGTGNESTFEEVSKPPIPIFDDGTKEDIDWNQYSSGNGDDLDFNGSVTLPSGITISTLNKFNACGMDTSDGNSWMGDIYSDIVAQNYEIMADNFDAFNERYNGSVINVTNGKQIWWRSDYANITASIELRKCDDHYKIIIWGPYLNLEDAQARGWAGLDSHHVDQAEDALAVLLSAITPNCVELQKCIVYSLYEAPDGQEPIDANGNWTTIGDCQIKVDWNNCSYDKCIWTFQIKP